MIRLRDAILTCVLIAIIISQCVHEIDHEMANRYYPPCGSDTECMEMYGGDGGPGR